MAKGRITAEDLSLGMQRVGGLGNLKMSGARRDSPFAFESESDDPLAAAEARTEFLEKTNIEDKVPRESSRLQIAVSEDVAPVVVSEVETSAPKKRSAKTSHSKVVPSPQVSPDISPGATKAEAFPERITLNLSEDMRDEINLLASKLQRQRTVKNERITSNTIIRTAIRILLEDFSVDKSDVVNSEEDLYRLVKQRLMKS